MSRHLFIVPALLLLFSVQVMAGNIFIEEGDLFIGSGVEVDFQGDDQELAREHILMGSVSDPAKCKELGLAVDPGQKLKLLNRGDGQWEILDLATGKSLGVLSNIVVK